MAQVHRDVRIPAFLRAVSPYTLVRVLIRHRCASHRYKTDVTDYNFGSLIRTDANDEYSEKNTIFSMSPSPSSSLPR